MGSHDIAAIRAALESLPTQCRYHGDATQLDGRDRLFGREACCDTGVPAQRRKKAEQALADLDRTPASTAACNEWSMSKQHEAHEWDGEVSIPGHFSCPGWPSPAGDR